LLSTEVAIEPHRGPRAEGNLPPTQGAAARALKQVVPLARNWLLDLKLSRPVQGLVRILPSPTTIPTPEVASKFAKPRLFLHVGMGKTGTTSIQQFCWANRALLERAGVTYPNLGVKAGAHHRLSPHVPPFLAKSWDFIDPADWAPQLAEGAHQPILLSSELMASAERSVIQRAAGILQRYFDVQIIIYVRRIDNSIMASYNQTVKAGTQRMPIEDALPGMFEKLRIDRVLALWTEAFGAANITVRPYDRGQFLGGDILRDFCAVVGVPWSADFVMPEDNPNTRLGRAALEFKRCLNVVVPDTKLSDKFNAALLDYSAARDARTAAIFYDSDLLPGAVRRKLIARQEGYYRELVEGQPGLKGAALFGENPPDDDNRWVPLALTPAAFEEIGQAVLSFRLRYVLRQQIAEASAGDNPQRLLYAARFSPLI
jgi:hypothetical protein